MRISDWSSDVCSSDLFAEAAAESLFASIVALDHATGVSVGSGMGKILSTPLHFIGHGRGTVVNSEIIQRLGTTFPNAGNPSASDPPAGNGGIQMPTLDKIGIATCRERVCQYG